MQVTRTEASCDTGAGNRRAIDGLHALGIADPGELIFVDALVRNESPYPIASLTAAFATGTGGSVPQSPAGVASPLPILPGQMATLRVPVIVGAAACPGSDNILVQFTADHRACDQEKLSFSLGDDCSFVGVNPDPPEEVPDGSVRVSKEFGDLRMDWLPPPSGAGAYNVYRGSVGTFASRRYSHVESVVLGAGECSSLDPAFQDLDDLDGDGSFYYLVSAVDDCGLEGALGSSHIVVGGALVPCREQPRGGGCP